MKKAFKMYLIGWFAVLALFNLITFIIPDYANKFSTMFWVAYALITIAFIIQLGCTYYAFSGDNLTRTFYNIPLIRVSITSLVVMFIAGSIFMAIPGVYEWLGIIICAAVLVVNIIMILKASAAGATVENIDKKIKTQTMFIRMFTADMQILLQKCSDEDIKKVVNSVYEAARYSDPMSNDALTGVENKISDKLAELQGAVEANDYTRVSDAAKQIEGLISERNIKCKMLK